MLIPVLGGPEEGGVMWVDEREVEAHDFDREPELPSEPVRRAQRGNWMSAPVALAVHFLAVVLRHR